MLELFVGDNSDALLDVWVVVVVEDTGWLGGVDRHTGLTQVRSRACTGGGDFHGGVGRCSVRYS